LSVEAVAAAFGRQEANTLTLGRYAEAGLKATPKLKTQYRQRWGQPDCSKVTSEVYPAFKSEQQHFGDSAVACEARGRGDAAEPAGQARAISDCGQLHRGAEITICTIEIEDDHQSDVKLTSRDTASGLTAPIRGGWRLPEAQELQIRHSRQQRRQQEFELASEQMN
jgi:hypothetical protein